MPTFIARDSDFVISSADWFIWFCVDVAVVETIDGIYQQLDFKVVLWFLHAY